MARHIWTPEEIKTLKELYPNTRTDTIAEKLGLSICAVYAMAYVIGLKKSDEFLHSPDCGRLYKGHNKGYNTQFKKGQVAHNKGKKMSPEAYAKCSKTMFKAGSLPKTTKHFGKPYLYLRKRKNGNIEKIWFIQVDRKRITYLSYLCKQNGIDLNGKIPRLKEDYDFSKPPTINDIYVIDYSENLNRNSLHRFPEELRNLIIAKGALNRQINKLTKNE